MAAYPRSRQAEARRCTEAMRDLLLGHKARLEEELRDTGITLAQLRMLKAVQEQTELSAAAIARLCRVTPQTLQSILARATREGWIVRGSSRSNGRIVTASLTPRGKGILHHAMEVAGRVEQGIWRGIPVSVMRSMRATMESGLVNLKRD